MADKPQELLRGIGGWLHVELSESTELITDRLHNRKAGPTAVVTNVRLQADVLEGDEFRPLSGEELSQVAFERPEIVMRGLGDPVRHAAPNGAHFTVRDLLAAVEETERATRHQSSWFDGVDVHHVFFQGLSLEEDDVWLVNWGS
jgi:hypothetical protein